jgi:hypothetical protein
MELLTNYFNYGKTCYCGINICKKMALIKVRLPVGTVRRGVGRHDLPIPARECAVQVYFAGLHTYMREKIRAYLLALLFLIFFGRLLPVEPRQIFPRLVRRSPLPMLCPPCSRPVGPGFNHLITCLNSMVCSGSQEQKTGNLVLDSRDKVA